MPLLQRARIGGPGARRRRPPRPSVLTCVGRPARWQLFGIAYFRNKKDASVKRGAIMKSIVLLSRRPFFSFYLPLLREALRRFMDEAPEPSLLQTLVDSLNGLNRKVREVDARSPALAQGEPERPRALPRLFSAAPPGPRMIAGPTRRCPSRAVATRCTSPCGARSTRWTCLRCPR